MTRDLPRIAETQALYILNDGKPVRAASPAQWLEWMKTASRPMEELKFPSGRKVYTSFMDYSGEHRESAPLTFATVYMPEPNLPAFHVTLAWYYTWNEALEGHRRHAAQFEKKPTPTPHADDRPRHPFPIGQRRIPVPRT